LTLSTTYVDHVDVCRLCCKCVPALTGQRMGVQ